MGGEAAPPRGAGRVARSGKLLAGEAPARRVQTVSAEGVNKARVLLGSPRGDTEAQRGSLTRLLIATSGLEVRQRRE